MFDGKPVTVVGLGVSGLSAARLLKGQGVQVKLTDNGASPELAQRKRELEALGIECELGGHTEAFLDGTGILVVSPGVGDDSLPVKWAKERGVSVMGEVELGYRFSKGTIIAISGTNGKSTVTSILGEIFKRSGKKTFVCGNIGLPLTSIAPDTDQDSVIVLEISSFQLARIDTFRPAVAIMLNITEDHLDRYSDFAGYENAKLRIFANQTDSDHAILNYDQTRFKTIKSSLKAKAFYFSKHRLPKEFEGAYIENEELVVRKGGKYIWIASKDSLSLTGEHNLENALAASLPPFVLGVDPEIIKAVLYNFKTLNHRFEMVDTVGGVKFIDDSKATNIDSARKAIQSSPKWIILIAGGKDKGGDYRVIAKLIKDKVKSIFLIGEAKERIAKAFSGLIPISFSETLEAAVNSAYGSARNGDTVLLSPMCSSFDMFKDYKERGDVFRRAVSDIKSKPKQKKNA